jgi:tetratricopeptide (TPR) repeat protein
MTASIFKETLDNSTFCIEALEINEESRLDFACALAMENRHPEAITEFLDILETNPKSTEALLELSKLHLTTHQYSKAVEYVEKALALDPAFFEGYVQLGTAYLKQNQEREAEVAFDQALRLNPRSGIAYCGLGLVQVSQGKRELAKQCFITTIDLAPQLGTAYLSLASMLRDEHRLEEAIELMLKFICITPDAHYGYECLGELHLSYGKVAVAKTYYEKALVLNPGSMKAKVGLGRVLIQSNELDKAFIIFKNMHTDGTSKLVKQLEGGEIMPLADG